jgi:hypothetical protein
MMSQSATAQDLCNIVDQHDIMANDAVADQERRRRFRYSAFLTLIAAQ